MNQGKARLIDYLVDESRKRQEIHPQLKRMILAAAQTALKRVDPNEYYKKCHGAAAAIFMILRTLGIRSTICGGTVSWLFGGVDQNGQAWEHRCGFWSSNPELPTPHVWIVTEYGGFIDLTCSYFHHIYSAHGLQSHDVLPMIWMRTEALSALPSVSYTTKAQYGDINWEACDEPARQLMGDALAAFWGASWANLATQVDGDIEKILANLKVPLSSDTPILDGPESLEQLRQTNGWVARNSTAPSAQTLQMPPRDSVIG